MRKRVLSVRSFAIVALVFLSFGVTTLRAQAADVNAEGSAHLKTMLSDYLERQQKLIDLRGGETLQLDGDVLVEPFDNYYAVTLPHASIRYADGGKFEIGIISINASPHDTPGRWKMSVAIPTPMIGTDANKTQIAQVILGSQRFAGIWDEGMEAFMKLDASYKDIKIENSYPSYTASIPELQLRFDFSDDGEKLWSGPAFIRLASPRLNLLGADVAVSTGEIKANFELQKYNTIAVKDYREKLLALNDNAGAAPSPQHAIGLYSMLSDMLLNTGDGFTSQYSVNEFHLIKPDGQDISIKTGAMGLDATGFSTGHARLAARFGYRGFLMDPAPPGYQHVQPKDVHLEAVFENLPFKDIADLGKNTLQAAASNPEMAKLGVLSFGIKLPAILSQSGAHLTIKDNFVSNDQYKVELNGRARADMSAVNSATAEAKAVFHGLDKLLAKTQVLGNNKNSEEARNFRELSATLETLKNVAKVETIPTPTGNQFVHVLDFVMNPQGQILVNGKDVFTLMSQKSQPAPAPVPEVAPPVTTP